MVAPIHHPENLPERLIVWAILGTWGLWLIGGLYIVGPALAWILALIVAKDYFLAPGMPAERRPFPLSWPIWIWIVGMAVMLLALFVGHNNANLGTGATIKSSIGWAKGWALLALFPLAGAALRIRAEVIYRAVCKLGLQTLFLLPIFLIAPFIGLPETLWVSPLKILGGSGDEYFAAVLYTIEPGVGTPRWQFFAPWSPAAGMVAVIHLLCAFEEKDRKWKWIGIAAGLLVIFLSQSRLALVALAVIWPLAWLASQIGRPWAWFAAVPATLLGGWFLPSLLAFAQKAQADFAGARADSTRVRETLGRIAIERWQNEAYWFGHGVVERGPHLVEYMPIGSHHSWYGLLFVKGLVGLLALAIPLFVSLALCFRAAMFSPIGRTGLSMVLVYILYSFGENLEVLTYLCWPALVIVGIALRPSEKARLAPEPT
jgi:hypothetical protein